MPKPMEHRNIGDTIAAFVAAAIYGTVEWYSKFHITFRFNIDLLNINWMEYLTIVKDAALQIMKSLPFILIYGFLGVIGKKAAEDFYKWGKNKILNKNKNGNNS